MCVKEETTQQRINKIIRLRAGKKGSITKRIDQLNKLINEGGSRTKVKYLLTAMMGVHKAAKELSEEFDTLAAEPDLDWIEELNLRVDTCIGEVQDYISSRQNEPASCASLTGSWVRRHAPGNTELEEQHDIYQLSGDVANLSIEESTHPGTTQHTNPAWNPSLNQWPNPIMSSFETTYSTSENLVTNTRQTESSAPNLFVTDRMRFEAPRIYTNGMTAPASTVTSGMSVSNVHPL